MTRIAHCLLGLVAMLLSATPNVTSAAIVTLTFESLGGHFITENLVESGFRISPRCHLHISTGEEMQVFPSDGNVLSYDQSGCFPDNTNPDFLGEPFLGEVGFSADPVFIDFFGHPFTFLSFHARLSVGVTSSKGGGSVVSPDCDFFEEICEYHLDGPEWQGVKWILLGDSGAGAPQHFFDNLVFRVPGGRVSEPSSLPLLILGLGLASLGMALRRRRLRLQS